MLTWGIQSRTWTESIVFTNPFSVFIASFMKLSMDFVFDWALKFAFSSRKISDFNSSTGFHGVYRSRTFKIAVNRRENCGASNESILNFCRGKVWKRNLEDCQKNWFKNWQTHQSTLQLIYQNSRQSTRKMIICAGHFDAGRGWYLCSRTIQLCSHTDGRSISRTNIHQCRHTSSNSCQE